MPIRIGRASVVRFGNEETFGLSTGGGSIAPDAVTLNWQPILLGGQPITLNSLDPNALTLNAQALTLNFQSITKAA